MKDKNSMLPGLHGARPGSRNTLVYGFYSSAPDTGLKPSFKCRGETKSDEYRFVIHAWDAPERETIIRHAPGT
jgi:hypothetical protein